MRFFLMLTDAYGSSGGIAKFNRDLIEALHAINTAAEIIVYPRNCTDTDKFPNIKNLIYQPKTTRNAVSYFFSTILHAIKIPSKKNRSELIFCGHIHLLLPAIIISTLTKRKIILVIHGVEAWSVKRVYLKCFYLKFVGQVLSVSEFTKKKFIGWSGYDENKISVFPNCVDISKYGIGDKSNRLIEKYCLKNKFIVMTLARYSSKEKYKGVDEMIDIIPNLIQEIPGFVYLVVGDGDDKERLVKKVRHLGIENHVIFTGFIKESEKADYYRLSDVFAMPGYGEGFGIVYLEAMACGVPVIASKADGSQEAVLNGEIGSIVDPAKPFEIKSEILKIFKHAVYKEKFIPDGLKTFSFNNFCERLRKNIVNI